MKTSEVAKAAGIAPRTKRYVARDAQGYVLNSYAPPHEQVFAVLGRYDITPSIDDRVRVAVLALEKSINTGRMNVHLAGRVRGQYTPYQLCALVSRVASESGEAATIGYLADQWINEHAADL
jgi:hypothetical protein